MCELREVVTGLRWVMAVILFISISSVKATMAAAVPAKPNCETQSQCGNVTIPYPFGIGDDCSINSNFSISCNTTLEYPPKPFIRNNIEVLDISFDGGLRILMGGAYDCYNTSGRRSSNWSSLVSVSFPINDTINKLTAIGCDTNALARGFVGRGGSVMQNYTTGCSSICNINSVINGSCSGIGCCQTNIPKGLWGYNVSVASYENHASVLPENPCSYAFVAEDGNYTFSSLDLRGYDFQDRKFPVTLDWTIGNINCSEAKKNTTSFACQENSICIDSENNTGYLCKCLEGFEGNPYLSNGCQDINECEQIISPCVAVGHCENSLGNYTCSCPEDYEGDGRIQGTGCIRNKKGSSSSTINTIATIGLFLGLGIWWARKKVEKLRKKNIRKKLYERNGGLLLQKKGGLEKTTVFRSKELEAATGQFHENRIIGHGGQGKVYRGMLQDGRLVAVKKAKIENEDLLEQFINEIVILSEIGHRNVVKLLGCCLETEVPLLVFEFVPNGTLSRLIREQSEEYPVPWKLRLRIANEVASAIAYLHSDSLTSSRIYHRDVKSSNILLDEKFVAKVSDFGASKLVDRDRTHFTTRVGGTPGYIDPEYVWSHQYTEKSDVYSFGVVLVELLTGKNPTSIFLSDEDETRYLLTMFTSSFEENKVFDLLDVQVLKDCGNGEDLMAVAQLAKRCLSRDGKDRPTMKEVEMELETIRNQVSSTAPDDQQLQIEIAGSKESTQSYDFTASSSPTISLLKSDGNSLSC